MATSTQVTVAIANATLYKINSSMSSTYWSQLSTNGINARLCLQRLLEIAGGQETHSMDGPMVDLFNLL